MGTKRYLLVSAVIFALVCAGHVVRALDHWALSIDGWSVPIWPSWVAAVGSGLLCVWALALRQK